MASKNKQPPKTLPPRHQAQPLVRLPPPVPPPIRIMPVQQGGMNGRPGRYGHGHGIPSRSAGSDRSAANGDSGFSSLLASRGNHQARSIPTSRASQAGTVPHGTTAQMRSVANGGTVQVRQAASAVTPAMMPTANSTNSHARSTPPVPAAAQPTSARPILRHPLPWVGDAELRVTLRNAPPDLGTLDIYELMKDCGPISFIEVLKAREAGSTEAKVVFQPPPRSADWFYEGITVNGRLIEFKHEPTSCSTVDPDSGRRLDSPPHVQLPVAELSFGVMQAEDKMLRLYDARPTYSVPVALQFNHSKKWLEISFPVLLPLPDNTQKECKYKLRLNIAQLKRVHQMKDDAKRFALIITTDAPPIVFRKTDDIAATHEEGATVWNEWMAWYRQTEITSNMLECKTSVVQLQKQNAIIDLGRWTTYWLTFDPIAAASQAFQDLRKALKHFDIDVIEHEPIEPVRGNRRDMWQWVDNPTFSLDHSSCSSDLHELASGVPQLSFEVRYQLEVCISLGVLHECNMDKEFLEMLKTFDPRRAVRLLEKITDQKDRFWDPKEIFPRFLHQVSIVRKPLPPYCAIIRAATVTPTTIYFSTPVMETSNRVVRQYSQYADHFLRVKFTDEIYKGKIMSYDDASMNEVFTRIKRTLANGIKVGDRHYEFLAAGNSQFREGSAWFFASTNGLTAQTIRDWMGDFKHIKVVAKYCSRVGQCFSTTRALQIGAVTVERIQDIERNGHTFTDGVGKISPFLARMIAEQHGLPNSATEYPSIFQFRLGGAKGVLAVDPSLTARRVQIRPSQAKFESINHADLNICRISQFSTANLNVQIILVLSALGVEDSIFLRKMKTELVDLEEAVRNSEKAIELLCRNVDFNQMTLQLAQMVENGFMAARDPFTISCLRLWHAWTVKYLKEKARIPIRKGAFVLGCVDETATLKGHKTENEGREKQDISLLPEIFIQVPDPDHKGCWKVIEGICTLARNPSLHPGDIRVVRAVSVPQLRHLRNCVVLPQTGDRDLASMCSGGDLDGDDYLVMWDEDLLPQEWNHPPMNYDAPPAKTTKDLVTVDDMTSFFVTHMKYDNLRMIAVAHKYWADQCDEGVKDPKCLELANLHSMAVDYAKTGIPAIMPKSLRVKKWPDWAQVKGKSKRCIYRSDKVIGRLFRMVNRINFFPAWDMPFDKRILDAYTLDDKVLEAAKEVKADYDTAVRRLMAKFGIRSDFEVVTTFALEHSDDFSDYKFAETLGEAVSVLKDNFQKLCCEKAETNERERDWEKMGPFIAAMYTVTAQEVKEIYDNYSKVVLRGGSYQPVAIPKLDNMPFMSFPWLFSAELGRIATKKVGRGSEGVATASQVEMPMVKKPAAKSTFRLSMEDMPAPLQEVQLPPVSAGGLAPARPVSPPATLGEVNLSARSLSPLAILDESSPPDLPVATTQTPAVAHPSSASGQGVLSKMEAVGLENTIMASTPSLATTPQPLDAERNTPLPQHSTMSESALEQLSQFEAINLEPELFDLREPASPPSPQLPSTETATELATDASAEIEDSGSSGVSEENSAEETDVEEVTVVMDDKFSALDALEKLMGSE